MRVGVFLFVLFFLRTKIYKTTNQDYPIKRQLQLFLCSEKLLGGNTYTLIFILIVLFSYKIDCHTACCKSDLRAVKIKVPNG